MSTHNERCPMFHGFGATNCTCEKPDAARPASSAHRHGDNNGCWICFDCNCDAEKCPNPPPASSSAPAVGWVAAVLRELLEAMTAQMPAAEASVAAQDTWATRRAEAIKSATEALAAPAGAAGQDAAREVIRIWDEHGYPKDNSLSLALNRLSAALAAQGDGGTTA